MRVVSMINGSLLSEAASFYAFTYAQAVQLPFTALFVDNGRESEERVQQSVNALQELANANEVEFEFVRLEGEVVPQLQHYCQLYAVDTLFCATRRESRLRSFSENIVASGIETDIAVVKVKNVSHVRSAKRLMLVSSEYINPHVYAMWLGLLKVNEGSGRIYLSAEKAFAKASTKSGLKYQAAPFMQIATLSGISADKLEVINALKPMDPEALLRYMVENNIDLVVFRSGVYPAATLNRIGDHSSVNSITFYPWKG
ncbi:universal stress protein [Thiomicrorhabdus sp. 6S3-12]|uniref:universal stress protein n=1 Tax=Thiomicrorhabdus sp. 6S3-12 TaxID=2819681 RepID=UPI001AAD1B4A|nr:universal stress protein [Thiomicrorhabdus sp. 6S3-12]MBO1925078.1 universal stress protein [Thiomicrorhabdus sp. 6S3-12]